MWLAARFRTTTLSMRSRQTAAALLYVLSITTVHASRGFFLYLRYAIARASALARRIAETHVIHSLDSRGLCIGETVILSLRLYLVRITVYKEVGCSLLSAHTCTKFYGSESFRLPALDSEVCCFAPSRSPPTHLLILGHSQLASQSLQQAAAICC